MNDLRAVFQHDQNTALAGNAQRLQLPGHPAHTAAQLRIGLRSCTVHGQTGPVRKLITYMIKQIRHGHVGNTRQHESALLFCSAMIFSNRSVYRECAEYCWHISSRSEFRWGGPRRTVAGVRDSLTGLPSTRFIGCPSTGNSTIVPLAAVCGWASIASMRMMGAASTPLACRAATAWVVDNTRNAGRTHATICSRARIWLCLSGRSCCAE